MSDAVFLTIIVALSWLLSALFAFWLARRRPGWPTKARALLAALPTPRIMAILCLFVFLDAIIDLHYYPERCGVDACGMAGAFSLIGLEITGLVYLTALFPSWVASRSGRP